MSTSIASAAGEPPPSNRLLAAALDYAALGWPVFPLVPSGKEPLGLLVPHGFKDATKDEETIREWWRREPRANVGIATGATSGVDVLDVDAKHDGRRTLADHEAEHGYTDTLTAETGGGGQHLYLAHVEGVRNSAGRLPGIDVRGDGGYIVAPPSIHPNGTPYRWGDGLRPAASAIAAWPPALLAMALGADRRAPADVARSDGTSSKYGASALRGLAAELAAAPEGTREDSRNRAAFRAGQLVESGAVSESDAIAALAAGCVANGLAGEEGDDAIRKRIAAGIADGRAKGRNTPPARERRGNVRDIADENPADKSRLVVVRIADVAREEVRWLWQPRIPRRRLTLVEGDPGLGKSFLTTQLVAAVTRGVALPDALGAPMPPSNVVMLTAEDGLGDTVRPRLEAAGADLSRVFAVTAIAVPGLDGTELEFPVTLTNIRALGDAMAAYRPALVVVDPVQAYLGAGVDMNAANEVRAVLSGLARLVEEYDAAAVLVRHLAKATGGSKLVYRGLGSIDFTGAARSILHVTIHPDDEEDRGRRVIFHVKANLSPKAKALGFHLDAGGFGWDGVVESREGDVRAAESPGRRGGGAQGSRGRPADRRDAAETFLHDYLAAGPRPIHEVLARGEDAGHAERTLRRAGGVLGVSSTGGRKGEPGTWALPSVARASEAERVGLPWEDANSGNVANGPNSDELKPAASLPECPDALGVAAGYRCPACGADDAWRSNSGDRRCRRCHPPGPGAEQPQ